MTRILGQVRKERDRADRAAAIAQRHEKLCREQRGSLGDLHRRLAAIHRQTELRHLAAAEMNELYAERLHAMAMRSEDLLASTIFMSAVAVTARSNAAAITLSGSHQVEAMAASSDEIARAAQEMEFTLGEGPNHDVLATGQAVYSSGLDLMKNWPNYGQTAADLGVRTVAAVPLEGPSKMRLGALAVFEPWLRERELVLPVLRTVADALTQSVLLDWQPTGRHELPPLFEQADYRAEVFQASGLVMVQCRCDFENALAMLRARAFALSTPISQVCVAVVEGRLRLDSD